MQKHEIRIRRAEPDDFRRPGWVRFFEVLVLLLAVKFLMVDTVFFRLSRRPPALAPAIANFQTFTALVVVSGLVLVSYLMTRTPGRAA